MILVRDYNQDFSIDKFEETHDNCETLQLLMLVAKFWAILLQMGGRGIQLPSTPQTIKKHTQKVSKMLIFPIQLDYLYERTDGLMDRQSLL